MNRFRKPIGLITLTSLLLASVPASAIRFSAAEKAALKAGKTVKKPLKNSKKGGFYGGSGFTLIDAPVEVVWGAIQDFGIYHRMFSATSSVKEVQRRGNRSLIHFKMGYKMISLDYYMEVTRNPGRYQMSFAMVENRPHDITKARGYWKLFPQKNGQTLVAYAVAAAVPMGVVNLMPPNLHKKVERNLIGAPNDVKKWLRAHGIKKYLIQTARN